MTTGDLPPNSKGGAFVIDPKVSLLMINYEYNVIIIIVNWRERS